MPYGGRLYCNPGLPEVRAFVRRAVLDAVARYPVDAVHFYPYPVGTGTRLYIGEALYKAGAAGQPSAWQDPVELSRHLTPAARYPQVRGHVFFAARDLAADLAGAMARVAADHYRQPPAPPR